MKHFLLTAIILFKTFVEAYDSEALVAGRAGQFKPIRCRTTFFRKSLGAMRPA